MNGVVSIVSYRDQILHVKSLFIPVSNGIGGQRVHVMDIDPIWDQTILDSKVAAVVPENDVVSNSPPFARPVEGLIEMPLESERLFSDKTSKAEIPVSVFEGSQA